MVLFVNGLPIINKTQKLLPLLGKGLFILERRGFERFLKYSYKM
jgi:hypothetical protein